jgi:excisionase family DNA binding protein
MRNHASGSENCRLAYSMREVARRLNCCERTVWKWINSGDLKCCRLGRNIRVLESDLSEFLERHRDPDDASPQRVVDSLVAALLAGDKERAHELLLVLRVEHQISLMLGDDLDLDCEVQA